MNYCTNQAHPTEALIRIWNLAQRNHGAARVAATLLLGMYNGRRFPFDLTDLRLLDHGNLEDALALMRMDARLTAEVHCNLNTLLGRTDVGHQFEHLAYDWKLKGRCKKQFLPTLNR